MSTDQEIIRIGKQLEKTVSEDTPNEQIASDLLKALQRLPMNLEVLQRSRVGLSVNTLRKKCEGSDVASFGKKLIKQWKKLLPADKSSPSPARKETKSPKELRPPTPPPVSYDPASSGSSGGGSENHRTMDSLPPKLTLNSQTSNGSSDSSGSTTTPLSPTSPIALIFSQSIESSHRLPSTGDDTRDKCVELLYKAMKKGLNEISIENDTRLFNLSTSIEQCIFSELRNTGIKYKSRIRSRVSNLGDLRNPRLKENVISGRIPPSRIAVMATDEMASDAMKKLRQAYIKEAIRDSQMAVNEGTKTDLLKCSKCGKRNCTYNQLQTRSSDEPMTTFCYCNECGHRWKFC